MSESDRRTFLKKSGWGAVGAAGSTWLAAQSAGAAEANERVRVGVIGCGGQGSGAHIGGLRSLSDANVEIAYVCDPDAKRLAAAADKAPGAKAVADLRKILEDKSVDVVTIATPDHWHTPAALLALEAGKHVYVEKPCSHNLREGRLLVDAARRTGLVVQHGTQMRSNQGFIEAIDMLREGVIGDVLIAKGWNIQRRANIGRAQPGSPPPDFDYDMWLGPAPRIPFQSNRHHYNWHWWYHFGTGDVGNDGVHEFDLARWGLGVDTHPVSAAVSGGKYFFDDDQQFPDTVTASFEYPGDGQIGSRRQLVFEMRIWCTNYPYNVDGGVEYWGTKGKMFLSRRGKFQLWGERNKPLDRAPSRTPEMNVANNLRAFLQAVRGDAPPTADAETAHLSSSLCHLANIAVRAGRSLSFDPQTEQITGDDEAAKLLQRTYRDGHWAAPQV